MVSVVALWGGVKIKCQIKFKVYLTLIFLIFSDPDF